MGVPCRIVCHLFMCNPHLHLIAALGAPPPLAQNAFLFWCVRTTSVPPFPVAHKIPPTRCATLHYSGGCSSCSHIVSWGVGMIPATMHPVSSCCA